MVKIVSNSKSSFKNVVLMYPINLPLKIGWNRVINRVDLVVVIVAVDLFVVVVDSKNLPLKFGKNRLSNS